MPALSSLSMYFQQATPVNATGTDIHIISICMIVIAIFFLMLIFAALFGAIYAMRLIKEIKQKGAELEKRGEQILADITAKTTPFVDRAHEIMEDLTPKIKSVTSDVEAISKTVRAKVEEVGVTVSQVNGTVQDANAKTRGQVARVDGIVTGALNTTHEISNKIQAGIRYPINHMAGWAAGLKAGLETLAQRSPWVKAKGKPSPYDL
jgi:uncharacterized protein YoxC